MNEIKKITFNDHDITLNILTKIIDNAEVGLYVADYFTCEILLANQKMALAVGETDTKDLIGKPCWMFVNVEKNGRCPFCPYKKLIDDDGNPLKPVKWEYFFSHLNLWIKSINQVITWTDGRLAHMITFYDITETKKMQEQIANIAFIDRLLNIKNGLKLEKDIQELTNKPSLIVFDILSLQKINEAYGRDIGDDLLISIRDWIIKHDILDSELYRIGGDEFCIAIRNIQPDALKKLADTIAHRFTEPWVFDHTDNRLRIFCNASFAVIIGNYIQNSEPLLNLIERTLKTARNKKTVTVYDEKMDKDLKKQLQFELSLKRCVREDMDGFDIYYQPITNTSTITWCGLEALCRWKSPELGMVSPLLFIPEAERLDLIERIGLWTLETAICKCKKWKLDEHKDFLLDVNISAAQFTDETLSEKIINILQKYDYPGNKLCLEITESTQFTFTDQSLTTIQRLRSSNVLVALDDFGTGYSNFNQLKNLPVDIIKIERSFITNIEHDDYHQYLFHAMAELTHTVNMKLIAEGVENKVQMDILMKNGADCLQGYLFSKPLSPADLEDRLHHFYEQMSI